MTVESLLAKSALYAAISRCFRRSGDFASLVSEVPAEWRDRFHGVAEKTKSDYSRVLGGTGACLDGEVSYRIAVPAGGILPDLAGFYQAFGFPHPVGAEEKLDHISTELEFVSFLYAKEAHATAMDCAETVEVIRKARTGFLTDHLGRWVAGFAAALAERDSGGFYAAAADAALQAVAEEIPVDRSQAGASDSDEAPLQCQGCPEAGNRQ